MKSIKLIFPIIALAILLLSNTIADTGNSLDARLNTFKYECKQLIKPARYEGSRITYYAASKEVQKKTVEAYFLLNTEYKLAFSGKECSTKTSVKIYDSADEKKRTLLKDVKGIQGKNVMISSKDLSEVFAKKVSKEERLKVVYIEYTIGANVSKNEAAVLVIGYTDI